MSTRVKVAIVLVLVAVIVGLIVYDSTRPRSNTVAEGPRDENHQRENVDLPREQAPAPQPAQQPSQQPPQEQPRTQDPAAAQQQQTQDQPKPQDQSTAKPTPQDHPADKMQDKHIGVQEEKPKSQEPAAKDDLTKHQELTDEPITHTIAKGDTYESLAQKYYHNKAKWKTIQEANPAKPANKLKVGDKVIVPPLAKKEPVKKPEDHPKKSDEFVKEADKSDFPREYEVRPNDNLTNIAKTAYKSQDPKYVKMIFEANKDKMKDANSLDVGMKLTLPKAKE